jgi:hypothetical protein
MRVQVPGKGTQISPGSLVQAKVTGRILPTRESVPGAYFGEFSDVWFWIGNAIHSRAEVLPILHLGSNGLRAAFIGIRVGSKVIVTFDSSLIGDSWILPKGGFMLDNTKEHRFSAGADHDYERFSQTGEYEFTIVKVCPARLMQRQGRLKQWGWIRMVEDLLTRKTKPFIREGTLEWAALEAECDSPRETVRFEKGPAYRRDGTLDVDWPESYESARWTLRAL